MYDDGADAPVGLTCTLFAVCHCPATPKRPDGPGSEVSTPSPSPQRSIERYRVSSLRLWLPYRVSPMRHRARHIPRLTPTNHAAHPFRGFFPFSVLPAARSHLTPVSFHLTGYVAPLGFRTPSTPCSPHDLLGLFHPSPAHGVFPSRLSSPRNAVRPLERRDPHAIGYDANAVSPPQGFARPGDPAHRFWGLAKNPAGCPLGFLPLRGFLPISPDTYR
jgi:hypothetical protein